MKSSLVKAHATMLTSSPVLIMIQVELENSLLGVVVRFLIFSKGFSITPIEPHSQKLPNFN